MLKLLMVDDEKWVRDRFSERIPWSDAGFSFMGAASGGEEAIRMIEKDMPHLLLTDITMPNMNGLELAGYVRKRWPRIRIVILTAYSEFEYARQAIELGVDQYLIKLAQTPDIIVDICRKIADEILQELDVDQKLEMRVNLEKEKDWARKRQWAERLMDDFGSSNQSDIPSEWLIGTENAGYWTGLTIGWSESSSAVDRVESTDEERFQLQRQLSECLENRLNPSIIGAGCRLVMLPISQNRLCILIASKQPLKNLHLNQLAMMALEAVNAFASVRSFIYIGMVRELGKQPLESKWIAENIREGLNGLAVHFYKSDSAIVAKDMKGFRRLDPVLIRETVGGAAKALQRENIDAFGEIASFMTQLSDHLIHPSDLLRLTKQMLSPELVPLPESVVARLNEIQRLETWTAYCHWWSETIQTMNEWLSKRLSPPATVRKEIQLMCRYIQKHYMEDVQVSELAKLVQLHPSYAGQMFKQEIGENFSDYVNRVRMEKASELLEQTTMKIYEVSSAVGISDYRYFCKIFKGYTGITPTQYKNKQA